MQHPLPEGLPIKSLSAAPLTLLCVLISGLAFADPHSFNIAPQPLASALNRLAAQSGLQVIVDGTLVAGKNSLGVVGPKEPEAALAEVLKGSGLTWRATGANSVMLEKAPESSSTLQLGETAIVGQEMGETTENTGSYTTGAMQTATKLPLTLRETPQSVSVVTRKRMDDKAMTTISDVAQSAPGIFLNNSGGVARPTFSARGFDVDTVMYDGFPTSFLTYLPSSEANLAMYDRVEIVRGATGLAQGAGSPAAAINLVRKRPTHKFQAVLTGSAGSWDDYSSTLDIGGPLNESGTLRARTVLSRQDSKSFRESVESDADLYYGVVDADLTDTTTLTLGAYRQKDYTNYVWGGLPMARGGGHLGLPRDTFLGHDYEYMNNRTTGYFATLEHGFANDWKLRMAAMQSTTDNDVLASSIWGYNRHYLWTQAMEQKERGYDLALSGPFQLLGQEHDFSMGLSKRQLDYRTGNIWERFIDSNVDLFAWDPRGHTKPNIVKGPDGRLETTTQDSLYASTRLRLTEPLSLILGGRLDWYEFESRATPASSYKVTRNLTRYAGLVYDLDANHSVYVSYTDIFKPQTEKGLGGQVIEPILGENYEVGIKGEYFDGALNASLAVFQIDQKNRAQELPDVKGCGPAANSSCHEASGLVRSRGVDLEIQGALTENWQLAAGYTYTQTKYVNDANATLEGQDFNRRLPRQLFKLSTIYSLPGDLQRWRIGGDVYQQSQIRTAGGSGSSAWQNRQGSYTVAGLVAGYKASEQLDLQFNVNNLFDRTYYVSIANGGYEPYDVYGDPRNFKLTARYSF
ncbi:TonB-dependent siderophore receptor [Pseudomonas proteolytica]|jgi:outer membrane receptor for ferric coprogen and ferric-rhodotorulic acid|uniref:TonB-dependent siderophore receptor n=1 Tax=Pseudomonas proteolytica TaxID=219574 RepID=A0AAW5AHZ4_9PSED|nr:TonB-dependent receptor [Pseudomonas proteolytica]TDR46200.1 outer membrane receptor for ferric coprogen and ferric-rhodotorulic acid [Pseudomonas brenneri]KAA8706104.1 TonB-dependent siderophore receptor [Pseudomonas proteolytica]MBC3338517.1 TonB-dependent siderophore receptor [Pseudomonas proteolytica]MCF5060827.1 TonB-dependent siderophore receptor [Pseudomonas proteolytica]MCF5102366.1 TonB-dependent siderophore receptor [Pseudomonas proteolytica]